MLINGPMARRFCRPCSGISDFKKEVRLLSVRWPDALLPLTKIRLPGFRKPQRGDIIVFVYPVDPTKDFIKRLIAVGGETVEIKDGAIYINGKEITDPRIKQHLLL